MFWPEELADALLLRHSDDASCPPVTPHEPCYYALSKATTCEEQRHWRGM